jgi:two-component sensor histidine kinase
MNKLYLLILFLIYAGGVLGQTSDLDELPLGVLREKLKTAKRDTNMVKIQLALGHLILFKSGGGNAEIDSALRFSAQSGILSKQLKYDFGIVNSTLLSAEVSNVKKDFEKGLRKATQALNYAKKSKYNAGIARSYLIIGQHYPASDPVNLQTRMNYNALAIEIFRKEGITNWLAHSLTSNADLLFIAGKNTEAIKLLFETINLGKAVSRRTVEGIYWNIGRTSIQLSDYPNALKYNLLALKTAKEVADTTLQLCSINNSLAVTYSKMQDYKRALPYSLKALEIAKRYKNQDYINSVALGLTVIYTRTKELNKALSLLGELKTQTRNDLEEMNIAVAFLQCLTYAKEYETAETYTKIIERLVGKIPSHNFNELMTAYNTLGNYYLQIGQTQLASHYTDLYAGLAREKGIISAIKTAEERYYQLESMRGNFKSAISHHLSAQKIKDSIENVTKAYQISILQIESDTEQKNLDIDTLTKQSQVKDAELKRNQVVQNAIIAFTILLLIISILVYSQYRLKRGNNRKLVLHQREIDQKNTFLETLNIKQEKLLKEKEWLIKEVHHRVKNSLQIVTSLLYSQSLFLKDDTAVLAIKDSLRRMHAMSLIHQKLYQDENISTIMMPAYVNDLVHYLYESFDADGQINFNQLIEPIELDVSQAIPLGLILTESIVNAMKYAFINDNKGTVEIRLVRDGDDYVILKVSDNGIGFQGAFSASDRSSLGLELMQGLAKQLNGNFHISDNDGVQITIKFLVLKK